jgi:Flp pilus assembly protein TadB
MEFLSKINIALGKKDMPLIAAAACAILFIVIVLTLGLQKALFFAPILCAIPLFIIVITRKKNAGPRSQTIMNESPAAIGMMRLMIDRGNSLDSAVREVAKDGPPEISKLLAKVVWDADTKASADIRDSLNVMIASLSDKFTAFKRSMYLIISASDAKDANERSRITKDADDTILEGLKEMGESYSSKLNAPCMAVFGLGVMIPMILVSILPMLSVGGQFSSSALDPLVIAALTLIVIPAVVAAVIMVIASGNPFYVRSSEKVEIILLLPIVLSLPAFLIVYRVTNNITTAIAISAVAAGLALFALIHPRMDQERKRTKISSVMGDVLFDLGNKLLTGENYEKAIVSSFRERNECTELANRLDFFISVSRGDTADAIRKAMLPYSEKIAEMYVDVYTSSLKDLRDAGRLATSIAHQLQDQNATIAGIKNKLRSMQDMMTGTSAVFAPLILGISISMLAPLMDLAGGTGMGFTSPILMAYLIELAALISILTTQLKCRGGLLTTLYTFSMLMPIALIVFTIASNISI